MEPMLILLPLVTRLVFFFFLSLLLDIGILAIRILVFDSFLNGGRVWESKTMSATGSWMHLSFAA